MNQKEGSSKPGDLLAEGDVGPESAEFKPEQSAQLKAAEALVAGQSVDEGSRQSWLNARKKIEQFRPVPWFIWRLSLSAFSSNQKSLSEGMVLGLRRLLFAAASDPLLGVGAKVNTTKKALSVLQPQTVAAVAIIHSVCRRLKSFPHERIWKPLVDEALVNAQIGLLVGKGATDFGLGRGMLAGFSLEIGMAVLIATGDEERAAAALDRLSNGEKPREVGASLYGAEPLQISAMLLAAAGCGQDASAGVGAIEQKVSGPSLEQSGTGALAWRVCSEIVAALRTNALASIDENDLIAFGFGNLGARSQLVQKAIQVSRSGHELGWLE